jgi:hypothetical protein
MSPQPFEAAGEDLLGVFPENPPVQPAISVKDTRAV